MAKLLGPRTNNAVTNLWLLLFRVAAGSFMLTHGLPKFLKILQGNFAFGDPIGIGAAPSLILSTFAEFLCSILLILGIGTRWVTVPLIINMLVAALIAHANAPFHRKELALMYLIVFITILVFGGGKYEAGRFLKRT